MSDIGINLDGIIAFMVAAGMGLVLALGVLIVALYGVLRTRRTHQPFTRQSSYPQMMGMLVSLSFCAMILLVLLATEHEPPPRIFSIWLDRMVWLWAPGVLALWPLSALVIKKTR